MKTFVKFVLMGLIGAMAGCGSHESKEARKADKDAGNRAVVYNASGRDNNNVANRFDDRNLVNPVPACANGPVNQAANQVVGAVDAATARTQQVTHDVNRTAAQVQGEVQQTANDAAQLGNDATHAVNSAARDLNNLKNAFR